MWVRGLKQSRCCNLAQSNKSHPVWVRGLKRAGQDNTQRIIESHPVWVRGLKLEYAVLVNPPALVAPRVGAWIETSTIVEIMLLL